MGLVRFWVLMVQLSLSPGVFSSVPLPRLLRNSATRLPLKCMEASVKATGYDGTFRTNSVDVKNIAQW